MLKVAWALLRPVLAFAVLLGVATGAHAQQYKWNMPTPYAEGSFHTKNTRMFADEIGPATNGRLDKPVSGVRGAAEIPLPDSAFFAVNLNRQSEHCRGPGKARVFPLIEG